MLRIQTVKVDDNGDQWLRPKQLQERFSMGRTTLWRLLTEMKAVPKYNKSVLFLSQTMKLINVADFREFLKSRDMAYLRE